MSRARPCSVCALRLYSNYVGCVSGAAEACISIAPPQREPSATVVSQLVAEACSRELNCTGRLVMLMMVVLVLITVVVVVMMMVVVVVVMMMMVMVV